MGHKLIIIFEDGVFFLDGGLLGERKGFGYYTTCSFVFLFPGAGLSLGGCLGVYHTLFFITRGIYRNAF
jgi:hypothetical protein